MRAIILERVSTRKQAKGIDIPMQDKACRDFVAAQGWTIVDVVKEIDVSGYKTSAAHRDAITQLKEKALNRDFDILLVYMADRISRKDSEGPEIVKWFNSAGIQVWSVKDGHLRTETRAENLINYMRFWQAEGESESTSFRVSQSHSQLIHEGLWRGGTPPFGYTRVFEGRTNKKGVPVPDMRVDPGTAFIVKEIFHKTVFEGFGTQRSADYFAAFYPGCGIAWSKQAISRIIRNPVYAGRLRYGSYVSENAYEEIRIVDDDVFLQANELLNARIPHSADKPTKTTVHSPHLLNGLLYCEHCGSRLVGTMTSGKKRAIYRCYGKANHKCTGQAVYSATVVENAVLSSIGPVIDSLAAAPNVESVIPAMKEEIAGLRTLMENARLKVLNMKRKEKRLYQELVKAVNEQSGFAPELISQAYGFVKQELQDSTEAYGKYKASWHTATEKLQTVGNVNVENWMGVFNHSSIESKKMVLEELIERISINNQYELKIRLKM